MVVTLLGQQFLTFSVLVANPKKLLYKEANSAPGLLNREKRTKEKSLAAYPNNPLYVCIVITYSRVWLNRVRRLPILLVVS